MERAAPIDVDELRSRLERSRRRTVGVLILEGAITVAGIAIGAGCAYIAWQWRDWFFALAALMLLLVCPACTMALYRLRRRSLEWSDRTPDGTVRYALNRLRLARRMLRMQLWGGCMLLVLVPLVWVGTLTGRISRFYPLQTISVLWTAAAIVTIAWSTWRLRRTARQYASCELLLAGKPATLE